MGGRAGPFVLLGFVVLGTGLAAWRPIPAGVWHDDGVYMLIGRALATGAGLTYGGVVGDPPAVKFPPVYPGFLALLWASLGEIGRVTLAATLANLVFLAVGAAALARGLQETGVRTGVALVAGGLAFVSGDVLRTTSVPLSEPFFLMLVGLSFALWPSAVGASAGDGPARRRSFLLLAIVLALAVATRAAGLAFVAGFGVATVLRAGVRSGFALIAAPLATWIAWSAWVGARARAIPEELRDVLGPYGGWLRDQLTTDPAAFAARVPSHVVAVLERVAVLLLPRAEGAVLWLAFVPVGALVLAGWAGSFRRLPPLAWSLPAYAGMLLAWPFVDRRLVVPLHVLAFTLACLGAWWLWSAWRPRRVLGTSVAAVALMWLSSYLVIGTLRIAEGWPTSAYRIRAERLATAVEALDGVGPGAAVVGAPEFWAALHLHGGWRVAPSAPFDPGASARTPTWGTPEAQERLWRRTGITYLLLEEGGLTHRATLDELDARCPGAVHVEALFPPQALIRLELDAC